MELFRKTNIPFVKLRNATLIASSVIILLVWLSVPLGKGFGPEGRGGINLGIDFSGGNLIELEFDQPFRMEEVRSALSGSEFKDAILQNVAGARQIIIKTKKSTKLDTVSAQISAELTRAMPDNAFRVLRTEAVGPAMGETLVNTALMAVLVAVVGIAIYLAFRFEFIFGVAAAFAILHDIAMVLGIFCLFYKEFNLLLITALLTVAGYSVNDTVVIFDRIRENLKLKRKEPLADIINTSINETLSRTVMTVSTVVMVLLALFFAGGEVIHDFSLALLIGVLFGSYSSIFIAAPIILLFNDIKKVWFGGGGGKVRKAA